MKELFYDLFGYNKSLFLFINNSINNEKILILLKYFSYLFDIEMFAIYYCCIVLAIFVRLKSVKNNEDRYEKFKSISNNMLIIGISYTIFGFLYAFLKFYINMPRPYCSLDISQFKTIADTASSRCLSSFPSSHAGISFMIAYFLYSRTRNFFMKIILIFGVFLVCLARISLAMHYPSDIFYGIILSYCVIKISQKACENKYFMSFSQYILNIIYSLLLNKSFNK
jgi:membrane-associated phospholipid phosphatase